MLINLRNAMMAGRRLPYDAELEYLESTGTQYVDTLVNADSNLSVEITMANAGTPWTNVNPMGAILATPRCRHHLNFDSTTLSNGINYYFGNGDSCKAVSGYKPSDGEIFTFKVDAINKTFALGSFLGTFPNDTFDTGLSYWLFGRNGTTPPYLGLMRICSAKLWNGSTLVRDFIPVRRGTVGYLYDRVTKRLFGNAGTGDFVLGPDVVPVEYIESHGTEYIDTGVVPTSSTSVEVAYKISSTQLNTCIFSARTSATSNSFSVWNDINGHYRFDFTASGADNKDGPSSIVGSYVSLKKDGNRNFVNGVETAANTQKSFSCAYPAYLFAMNNGGVANFFVSAKGAFCKIWQDSTPVRSFCPVRVGTEGAMMDVLTRRIYRNAGTGAFTYGNDLKYPIPKE